MASKSASGAKVVVLQETGAKGALVEVPVGEAVTFGREKAANEIIVNDKHVSRTHCTIEGRADGAIRIVCHGRTGTYVDGARVAKETVARPGRKVRIGPTYELLVVGLLDPTAPRGGEPAPPCRLGPRYVLLGELGRGGMGVVYEAWDEQDRRRCAVKWLRVGGQASDEDEARFTREAKLQASLKDYPGIARVFDHGKVPGTGELYCVMELVEGDSLEKRIRADQGVPRFEAVRFAARTARAVEFAHARGIVHRDLKPSNILIGPNDVVRLTDFGIARTLDGDGRLTATGIMLGTPGFMAPEQIRGVKDLGPSVDVWGLGAVLYALLVRKAPTRGTSMREVLHNALLGEFDHPRELDPTIDEELESICLRALATEPAERFESAADLAAALERWLARPGSTRAPKAR
jgi:serine/threonine protein kinase